MAKLEVLETNKPSSDDLPTKTIQEAKEVICPYLTDSINATMDNCIFPDKLEEADVRAIHNKGDPCQIMNYKPISILSVISEYLNESSVNKLTSL